MNTRALAVWGAVMCSQAVGIALASEGNIYVEFRWAPSSADDVARQLTLGFVMDGVAQHQVCVAEITPVAKNKPVTNSRTLRIDVRDARGTLVSSNTHHDFKGSKRCYDTQLGKGGVPGEWKFEFFIDDEPMRVEPIQVARTLSEAPFYRPSSVPYVLGRPNYDPSISPNGWKGRLVWIMEVNEKGDVTGVEIEAAEGVGELIKDRAISAGYMSRFPPDPSRAEKPLRYRRELKFEPDK